MSFQVFCPVPVGSIKFSLLCHIAWHETKNRKKIKCFVYLSDVAINYFCCKNSIYINTIITFISTKNVTYLLL